MTSTKPGRDSDQFALRLPDGMRDIIKASAQKNSRSMNAEIIVALEMYLGVTGGKSLRDDDNPETFNLAGLPEEEQLRKIIQSSAQTMYEDLKKALRAPPADISNPPPPLPLEDEK